MEEEEDDLYGTSNGPSAQAGASGANGHDGALEQNVGEELEEGEEEEDDEEDSESVCVNGLVEKAVCARTKLCTEIEARILR
jgi:hypothetical protein